MGKIATALSSMPQETLPSSTETPTTSRVKNVKTCKVIKLRSGKECESPSQKEVETSGFLPDKDNNEEKDMPAAEPTSVEAGKYRRAAIKLSKTPEPDKKLEVLTRPDNEKKFVQERPPPPFPQRIKKAKEEQQFGKFMEILKQLHIIIPLVETIE